MKARARVRLKGRVLQNKRKGENSGTREKEKGRGGGRKSASVRAYTRGESESERGKWNEKAVREKVYATTEHESPENWFEREVCGLSETDRCGLSVVREVCGLSETDRCGLSETDRILANFFGTTCPMSREKIRTYRCLFNPDYIQKCVRSHL